MNDNNDARVLAVAIDAAEPWLIREMIEQDKMPALKSLLCDGRWISVKAPAHIGSGSVWPTFITGEDPAVHGVYGEWPWQSETMSLNRCHGRDLTPFWQGLVQKGIKVGILDVPFMPFIGLSEGFEIGEWGPHDLLNGRTQVVPERVAELVAKHTSHPLSSDRLDSAGARDYGNLKRLIVSCLGGVKLRGSLAGNLLRAESPSLALIAFTEIHHAAHFLWHTIASEHEIYDKEAFKNLRAFGPTLKDIYHEVDSQIGKLVETIGEDATVLVFSLHGMRPAHGMPAFLAPLLGDLGFAKLAGWSGKSWSERAISLLAAVKREMPGALKKLYYKTVPITTVQRLARPTMLPPYDWSRTRAFSLPSDQHGWIRINLIGREAQGIVPVEQYEEVCEQLEQRLRPLTTEEGKPLVRDVIRTVERGGDARVQRLPDLVVHWEDAVFAAPFRIKGASFEAGRVGRKFSGQHGLEGFCIFKGRQDLHVSDTLAAKDMHTLIAKLLETVGHETFSLSDTTS